jgi:two-component system OmpR family response regulator
MNLLVVDDDTELLELVSRLFGRLGHRVTTAADVAEARAALVEDFDVIVLDLGLPDGSGLELCSELRATGLATPILLLTAQSAVSQRVGGLDAGADDYLTKPFALAELRARVAALGRRQQAAPVVVIEIGETRLDMSRRRARRAGYEVELTPREWSILDSLALRRGRVVQRWTVLDEVWESDSDAAMSSLEVLVSRIRRKLGSDIIRTVRGEGYALG